MNGCIARAVTDGCSERMYPSCGARALKSVSWLLRPETLPELTIVVFATRPAERLMSWLFEQQQVPWMFSSLLMM